MWKQKLCLNCSKSFPLSVPEQLRLYKRIGFDGVFFPWSKDDPIDEWKAVADEVGLTVQSIHAPFNKIDALWRDDEERAKLALDELLACIHTCQELGVPIMVSHAFIGFRDHTPTEIGLKRFEIMVNEATKCGVKIAFENTEGEEYLAALMEHFKGNGTVGFCWDTGHEMCYNHSQDMLSLYGDRLIATHINDNLGIRDFDGEIIYTDDLHLLPFDGIGDWDGVAARLDRENFSDFMTFELKIASQNGRIDNVIYENMPFELWVAEAFKRACRVAAKRKQYRKG